MKHFTQLCLNFVSNLSFILDFIQALTHEITESTFSMFSNWKSSPTIFLINKKAQLMNNSRNLNHA